MMFVALGTMWGYYSNSTFLQLLAVVTNIPTFLANETFQSLGIAVSVEFDTIVFGTIHFIIWGVIWWFIVMLYRAIKSALNKKMHANNNK